MHRRRVRGVLLLLVVTTLHGESRAIQTTTPMAPAKKWASDELVKSLLRKKSECTPQTHNNHETVISNGVTLSRNEQLAIAREASKRKFAERRQRKQKRLAYEQKRGVKAIGTFHLQVETIDAVNQFAKDYELTRSEAIRTLLVIGLNAHAQGE